MPPSGLLASNLVLRLTLAQAKDTCLSNALNSLSQLLCTGRSRRLLNKFAIATNLRPTSLASRAKFNEFSPSTSQASAEIFRSDFLEISSAKTLEKEL